MRNYIIKRVAQSVLILFCVMFIIYALIRSLPSSFAETMAMQLAQAPGAKPYEEWLAQLNASYGLDLDIVPGFFTWLSKAVVGNFGDSWKWNVPATQKFTEVIGLSVIMGGISFVLSIVIAVPLGVLAATKQYSRTDYVITAAALVGISLPTFFFATLLKLLFSVKLGWVAPLPSRLAVRPWGPFSSRVPGASMLLTCIVQWNASPMRVFISSKVRLSSRSSHFGSS